MFFLVCHSDALWGLILFAIYVREGFMVFVLAAYGHYDDK